MKKAIEKKDKLLEEELVKKQQELERFEDI